IFYHQQAERGGLGSVPHGIRPGEGRHARKAGTRGKCSALWRRSTLSKVGSEPSRLAGTAAYWFCGGVVVVVVVELPEGVVVVSVVAPASPCARSTSACSSRTSACCSPV